MSENQQNTRFVGTVKVRKSGGRSLEVTIPMGVVKSMGLEKNDDLIVLEDKITQGFIMYVNPKKASLIFEKMEIGLTLDSSFSFEEIKTKVDNNRKR